MYICRKFFVSKNFLMNIRMFNFAKKVKIVLDENNNKKIVYEDYNSQLEFKEEKEKEQDNLIKKPKSYVRAFGDYSIDDEEIKELQKEEVKDNLIKYEQYFSDACKIYVKAGDGGNGIISWDKGPLYDQKTPMGGNGGKGGDVIFESDININSLSAIRTAHIIGNNGQKGMIKAKGGKNAKDIIINVPVGTIVSEIIRDQDYQFAKKDLRATETYETKLLFDFTEDKQTFVVCKGGNAGFGNYSKRNINKESPLLRGKLGEEKELQLVYKCSSDVVFVGFPNAGKSTLLAALTRSVPKIASYAFTTLHPHVGKLRFDNSLDIRVADLPGLIEGAHMNKGLGHKFLQHIERSKLLLFLLDGSIDPNSKENPIFCFETLLNELKQYNENYLNKKYVVVLNKSDLNPNFFEENYNKMTEKYPNYKILKISAKNATGLDELSNQIYTLINKKF